MTNEFIIKNCTLDEFSKMFGTRKDYIELVSHMDLKERVLSPKPTNDLEANLKKRIIDQARAIVKFGSSTLQVTSYSVKKNPNQNVVYISYGGKGFRFTAGRYEDVGGFFEAKQFGSDLNIKVKTRYEYYLMYKIFIIIGFLLFIVPGIILSVVYIILHKINSEKINKLIVPTLIETFE